MKNNRLQYRITHISGEEPGHSASELLNLNSSLGYHSPRFAVFPLELILQFTQAVQVETIQIMAHQFKIPQSIDIHLGNEEGFAELGTIEFDSNIRHNFSVKELKTV
jgi:centrosomal protein CEP104